MKLLNPYILLAAILLIAITCYLPGLYGYFQYDDSFNISRNGYLRIQHLDLYSLWQAAMSGSAGMLKRPISMVTFALNYYAGGFDPYYLKLTNLVIHLINGMLVFALTGLLLKAYKDRFDNALSTTNIQWLSIATAAAWLLHPMNISGVLYVVQRMTSLAALFMLLGMILYLHGRTKLDAGKHNGFGYIAAALLLCTPLAMFCKENGALLPPLLLVLEWTILGWKTANPKFKKLLVSTFVIVVGLPVAILFFYILTHPDFITAGYHIRDFNLTERLMTESRILWFYLRLIFIPDITAFGFYHDDIVISRGLLDPPTTLTSIIGLILLAYAAIRFRKQQPLLSFGILFFLVGQSMESSLLALGLIYEHRNYLPIYGALLPLMFYLVSATVHPASLRLRGGLAILFIMLAAGITAIRASHWGNPLEMKIMEVQHHPRSANALTDLGYFYMYVPATSQLEAQTNFNLASRYFQQAIDLSNTDTTALFGLVGLHAQNGLNLDDSWWDELARRLKDLPFAPNSGNSLAALEKCHAEGKCKLRAELMKKLLVAALQNKTLSGMAKTQVLFAWSDFLLKIRQSPELATEAAFAAVETSPGDIEQRFTLITMLINMRKYDLAKTELERLKMLDRRHMLKLRLDEFEMLLRNIR